MVIQDVDLQAEIVTIVNVGGTPRDMTGWTLLSTKGGQRFVFPQLVLPPGGTVRVTSGPNGFSAPPEVFQWLKADQTPYVGYVWNNDGDPAVLLDSEGDTVSTFF